MLDPILNWIQIYVLLTIFLTFKMHNPYGTSSQNILASVFTITPPSTALTGILTVAYPELVLKT